MIAPVQQDPQKNVVSTVTLQGNGTEIPTADNDSTVHRIPSPSRICHCPMEPMMSVTTTPAPIPDDGLCHCT